MPTSACDTLKELRTQKLKLASTIKQTARDCESEKYHDYVSQYFSKSKNTVKDLLKCIYHTYRTGRAQLDSYTLSLKSFIDLFPRDASVADTNFKRQHVFEHMCRLLLMYNDDSGELGMPKEFYTSLETFHPKTSEALLIADMIKERINTGSSAQSVDIFFKVNADSQHTDVGKWACENSPPKMAEGESTFVLIQCKYYEHEKSEPSKYDLPKMYSRARRLEDLIGKKYNIVLMVNDKHALEAKFKRQRFGDHQQLDKHRGIYGVKELDEWFQNMLHRAILANSFEEFINIKARGNKPGLQLRFHQRYFINATIGSLDVSKKFVWGAVPRSGKTYMIGGMIAQRNKDVIIILGAKSETEGQFCKLFKSYHDFDTYRIVVGGNVERDTPGATATIYLWSQEYLKNKVVKKTPQFTDAFQERKLVNTLFNKKHGVNVDLYFDEVHKGGSTEQALAILLALLDARVTINFFTMVTATFAKPTLAYETLPFDKKKPVIIEWSYQDNQFMKDVAQAHTRDLLLSSRTPFLRDMLDSVFNYYKSLYGASYLTVLESDYKHSPELVIVQPQTVLSKAEQFNTILKNAFSLKCAAFDYVNTDTINKVQSIFEHYDQIRDLLSLIAGPADLGQYKLLPSTVYGFLKNKFKYDIQNPHTELWFIPATDLYGTQNCDAVVEKNQQHLKKLKKIDMPQDDTPHVRMSRPHIEPISRGVALALMKHPYYKAKCCVLIVHEDYALFQAAQGEHLKEECVFAHNSAHDKDMVDFIKQKEHDAKKKEKTLIILAAHKLRLGVSLPCADIVMNFDSVQSVDRNYQTMFRCLTERQGKRYGYYIDFNKERAIDFLYTYNTTYGSGATKTVDEDVMELQQLMMQFNYNGITFVKEDQFIKLYHNLMENMHITRNDYVQRTADLNVMQKTLRNVIVAHGDFKELTKLYKLIHSAFSLNQDETNQKVRVTVKDGKKGKRHVVHDSAHSIDESSEGEEEDTEDSNIAKTISELLLILPPLLAIFSIETELQCSTLDDCFHAAVNETEYLSSLGNALCSCESEKYSAVGCYLTSVSTTKKVFAPEHLKLILNEAWNVLDKNKRLHNILKIQFESVREETMRGNRLVDYFNNVNGEYR
jgi:hypothetical protein